MVAKMNSAAAVDMRRASRRASAYKVYAAISLSAGVAPNSRAGSITSRTETKVV